MTFNTNFNNFLCRFTDTMQTTLFTSKSNARVRMASLSTFITVLKREVLPSAKATSSKTVLTILAIFGVEKLLTSTNLFKCPKEGYQLYSAMFLFVPVFCLAGLTLLTNAQFWDSAATPLRGNYVRQKIVCSSIFSVLGRAFLVGIFWLVIAFGTTDFYVCFRVGKTDSEGKSEELRAQSTTVAWVMLATIILMSLSYLAIRKCCCSRHERECAIQTLQDYERQAYITRH